MNTIYRGLFTLVKSALTGQKLELPEGFTLEQADALIRNQALIPLIYPGALNCGIDPKSELMQKYQVLYFRHLVISQGQMVHECLPKDLIHDEETKKKWLGV